MCWDYLREAQGNIEKGPCCVNEITVDLKNPFLWPHEREFYFDIGNVCLILFAH